jgi:hypothetical protein
MVSALTAKRATREAAVADLLETRDEDRPADFLHAGHHPFGDYPSLFLGMWKL